MGESSGVDPVHFARLRPGESIAYPSWLLRRTGPVDELLGRDGEWRPTRMLARAERGELPGELKPVVSGLAGGLTRMVQSSYGAARRALAQQQAGEFVLRMAEPGTAADRETLDAEARAELAGFLTGAPAVHGGFRTDGMWVWPESLAEAVLTSGEPPAGLFHHHIKARSYSYPASVAPGVIVRARRLVESGAAQEDAVPGRSPAPTPEERLRQLGAWHGEWQRRHAARTPYRPGRFPDDPDYDQHHVDVEASPEADLEYTRRAREIMGQDPETGQPIDV